MLVNCLQCWRMNQKIWHTYNQLLGMWMFPFQQTISCQICLMNFLAILTAHFSQKTWTRWVTLIPVIQVLRRMMAAAVMTLSFLTVMRPPLLVDLPALVFIRQPFQRYQFTLLQSVQYILNKVGRKDLLLSYEEEAEKSFVCLSVSSRVLVTVVCLHYVVQVTLELITTWLLSCLCTWTVLVCQMWMKIWVRVHHTYQWGWEMTFLYSCPQILCGELFQTTHLSVKPTVRIKAELGEFRLLTQVNFFCLWNTVKPQAVVLYVLLRPCQWLCSS